jgi:predicted nucleic acid-binding protein
MIDPWLLDTDILVEYLRGNPKAITYLDNLQGTLMISAVTMAELFSGARNEREAQALEQFLHAFEVIPVDREIARLGGLLRRDHRTRHGTGLADALIAATARHHGVRLVTLNKRHFRMLAGVQTPQVR